LSRVWTAAKRPEWTVLGFGKYIYIYVRKKMCGIFYWRFCPPVLDVAAAAVRVSENGL
jgi:hypothetical protein